MATGARSVCSAAVLLAATIASAHAVSFDFVTPQGAGNRTDAGLYTLSWTDGPDPAGTTLVQLYVSRPSLLPWGIVDGGVTLAVTPGAVAVADPVNDFTWDSAGVPAGCYQAWARMVDPIEGSSTIPARGLVTVVGANVPPAVWIINPSTAAPNDAGQFALTFLVDDPEDATFVTLEAQTPTGTPVRLATDLPISAGGGTGSFPISTGSLAPGVWYLHALVRDADGGSCDAWWPGALYLSASGDGGSADAGVPDSGAGGGGGTGGGGTGGGSGGAGGGGATAPGPCGCAASGTFGLVALAFTTGLLRRARATAR